MVPSRNQRHLCYDYEMVALTPPPLFYLVLESKAMVGSRSMLLQNIGIRIYRIVLQTSFRGY